MLCCEVEDKGSACTAKVVMLKYLVTIQLHDYYANVLNAVMEKIHAVGADT